MNTGLQDAANLSWKLAAALRGRTPDAEALLDSYQTERHPVGKTVLRTSGSLVRLAMAHNPLQRVARSLFTRIVASVRPASNRAIGMISGLAISYGQERGAHPLTGKRAPDLELAEGRLYEVLRRGEFVLVTPRGGEAPATLGSDMRPLEERPPRHAARPPRRIRGLGERPRGRARPAHGPRALDGARLRGHRVWA